MSGLRFTATVGLTGDVDVSSPEFHAVRVLADPAARRAVRDKDPIAFLNAVSAVPNPNTAQAVPSDEPCCVNAIVSVNALVDINVVGTAVVYAVAVALLAVSVIVFVAVIGERPF